MGSNELLYRDSSARQAASLKYTDDDDELPSVIAKGMGALAELIERLADVHGVSVARQDELAKLIANALPEIESNGYKVLSEVIECLYCLESEVK